MRKLITLLCVSLTFFAFSIYAGSKTSVQTINANKYKEQTIVWAGIDCSKVTMYGTEGFNNPEDIISRYPEEWNTLFLKERLKEISKILKKDLVVDISSVQENNTTLSSKQIIAQDGKELLNKSDITPEIIAEMVSGYEFKEKEGLGVVFILDRLVKSEARGSLFIVFFDLSSKEILATNHTIEKAGGFGFRNYWFSIVKNSESNLKKYYKK